MKGGAVRGRGRFLDDESWAVELEDMPKIPRVMANRGYACPFALRDNMIITHIWFENWEAEKLKISRAITQSAKTYVLPLGMERKESSGSVTKDHE